MVLNIHAGHCPHDKGSNGAIGFLTESIENRIVTKELIQIFQIFGDTVYDCTCDENVSAQECLCIIERRSKKHDVDLNISIHLNSSRNQSEFNNSSGCEVITKGDNINIDKLANDISKEISNELKIPNRGLCHRSNLYLINNIEGTILIECCFVDNQDDVQKWDPIRCANAIYKGITGKNAYGWIEKSNGFLYRNSDGTIPRDELKKIDRCHYYFNRDGYMVSSTWITYNDNNYYFKEDGKMATGWVNIDNNWYFFNNNGIMIKDSWIGNFYLKENGQMARDETLVIPQTYTFDKNGNMTKL